MRFFDACGVSEKEIEDVWPELKQQLASSQFETFLSRDFFPWRTLMNVISSRLI